jgi:hypothetical protein
MKRGLAKAQLALAGNAAISKIACNLGHLENAPNVLEGAVAMVRKTLFVVSLAVLLMGPDKGFTAGFTGWQVVRAASDSGTPGTAPKTVFAKCPSGKKVLGGGAVIEYQQGNSFPADPNGIIFESEPTGDDTGWQASGVDRTSGDSWAVIAYAICAKVG